MPAGYDAMGRKKIGRDEQVCQDFKDSIKLAFRLSILLILLIVSKLPLGLFLKRRLKPATTAGVL
jgi:hypothetical protein